MFSSLSHLSAAGCLQPIGASRLQGTADIKELRKGDISSSHDTKTLSFWVASDQRKCHRTFNRVFFKAHLVPFMKNPKIS